MCVGYTGVPSKILAQFWAFALSLQYSIVSTIYLHILVLNGTCIFVSYLPANPSWSLYRWIHAFYIVVGLNKWEECFKTCLFWTNCIWLRSMVYTFHGFSVLKTSQKQNSQYSGWPGPKQDVSKTLPWTVVRITVVPLRWSTVWATVFLWPLQIPWISQDFVPKKNPDLFSNSVQLENPSQIMTFRLRDVHLSNRRKTFLPGRLGWHRKKCSENRPR